MSFRPLHDRILVKRSTAEQTSRGGIIIPENAKEKPARGEVLAVGPGKLLENGTRAPMDVKPGDVVLFGKYSGSELQGMDDEVVITEADVLGVFEP
jgi:chaperonin GroES